MNTQLDQEREGGEGVGMLSAIPSILWERKWFVVVPIVLGLLIGIAVAFLTKPSYESKATMLVQSDDVPGQNDAQDGDEIDRRMAKVRERILSRPELVELIQSYNLYDAASHKESLSTLVDRVRSNTSLDAISGGMTSGSGRNHSSIAFALTYSYPKPIPAQAVAQSFVDRLLKLDSTTRVSETQNGVNLLENQQQTLQTQLTDLEGQLNQLTGANGLALSGAAGAAMRSSGNNYESQISALQQRNADLRLQMGTAAVERNPQVVTAEGALAAATAQFADDHPDVLLARKRLDAARRTASTVQQTGVTVVAQQQIAYNNALIGQMSAALDGDRARAAQVAMAQSRGPEILQRLNQLGARATQVRDSLGRVTSQLLSARSAAEMAAEQRGERLTLIDPPVAPDSPTSPNRPLLILGGLLGGIALGLLLAFGLELLFRPIRGVAMLTGIVGVPPLSVVPVLKNSRT